MPLKVAIFLDSCKETCCMVGRAFGFCLRHSRAIFTTDTISAAALLLVGNRTWWSITSLNFMLLELNISGDDEGDDGIAGIIDDLEGVNKEYIRSPGCFPMITSRTSTPKLNISDFAVTCIVKASSVEKMNLKQRLIKISH